MKGFSAFLLLTLTTAAFSQAVNSPPYGGRTASSRYDGYYNRLRESKITGVVTGKVKGAVPGLAESVSILVRTPKKRVYQVDLGPSWYVSRQNAKINLGDKVRVTGSLIKVGRREQFILARRIIKGNRILTLRDGAGVPYYAAYRRAPLPPVSQGQVVGTITGTNTYMVDGEQYRGVVLQTSGGPVDVALAPSWYLDNQGMTMNVGDHLTVVGAGTVATLPGNVVLASNVYGNGGVLVLRPSGTPAWSGFLPYGGG